MSKPPSLIPLLVLSFLFLSISCATYTPDNFTLQSYELANITILTQSLSTPLSPAPSYGDGVNQFNMTITANETRVPVNFPFSSISTRLPYFSFRLFNFGNRPLIYTITFSCNSCDPTKLSRVLSITKSLPSRAQLGANKAFAIVITSSLLSKISLPLNLYEQTQSTFVDYTIPDFINNFNYSGLASDETIYDSSFWNDVTTLTLPWLPFFTHCTNQDRRLLLFDILENSPESCIYKSADQIKTIGNIPTTGFTSETDSCDLSYTCYHVQTGKGKSYGTPWYSVTGTKTLYYIYRNPLSISEILSYKSDRTNDALQVLVNENSETLIPVTFRAEEALSTGVPLQVEMKISFFQATLEEKDIISVEVVMRNYVSGDSLPYSLTISYIALDYFGMINSFRVGIIVYLFVFFFMALVIVTGAWGIWRLNKLIFSHKKKIHPTMKFLATFKITFFPQLAGTFYATVVTILIFSLVTTYFKEYIDLTGFTPNFNLSNINSTVLLGAERGRIGLACLLFSLFVLRKGMELLIPIPTKEETKVIVKHLNKKKNLKKQKDDSSDGSKSDTSLRNDSGNSLLEDKGSDKQSDQDSNDSEEKQKESNKVEGNTLILRLRRKRDHVMLVCILASVTLVFVVEPSSDNNESSSTTETSTLLMVLLMIADVAVILILKHFLLKEILLLAPITTAFEIVQFVLVMRADTFVIFLWSYLLRTFLIVMFRIYLDPILKNMEIYVQKIAQWVRSLRKDHILSQIDPQKEAEMLRWKNVELILKKPIENKGHFSVEFIVFILVNYTTKQCARMMFPVYLLFTYVFPNENQISSLFGINQQQLVYYIIFWFILVIPSYIMDVYILNILEIVHGHKLYDYLSYCEYRFNFRTTKWIASSNRKMDRSVSPEHRSIHNFCFSKQFYFTVTLTSWGILFFMSGIYIIYANDYKPFADSALFPMLLIILAIFHILRLALTKFSAYIDLWKQPRRRILDPSKRIEEEKKRLEKHLEIDKMIRTNFFRLFFVHENKDWIITNLKNFVGSENFHDNEGYLLRIYQRLVDEEIRENNEKKRKEFINQKKLEHASQLTMQDLMREDEENKGDYKPYPQEEKIPRIKKSVVRPMTYLLYHWYYFAKQNIYLMNLVADIDNSKIASSCGKCGQEYALLLVPQRPLVDLLAQFRIQYAGLPFNKYEWRKFYEKKQLFKTLCNDCKFIDLMKKRKLTRTKSRNSSRLATLESTKMVGEHAEGQEEDSDPFESPVLDKEEEVRPDVPVALKKMLLALKWAAKSRLLHRQERVESDQVRSSSRKTETKRELQRMQSISWDGVNEDEPDPVEEDFERKKKRAMTVTGMTQKSRGFDSARA